MNFDDPVITNPELYKILLENEHLRIVEMILQPGQKDDMHGHPHMGWYAEKGGKLRVNLKNGETKEMNVPDGKAMYQEPIMGHQVENIGETLVKLILFEFTPK